LSRQIDALLLPYREVFAAVFFVTLGTFLQPALFWHEPLALLAVFIAIVVLKAAAAALALRLTGLAWRTSVGMGLGLAQLGEFSFVLLTEGVNQGVIGGDIYNRMLFVALATLIITPLLLRVGLAWGGATAAQEPRRQRADDLAPELTKALVVGAGPIGRQIVSRLELLGIDVRLIDLSPINLYAFEQQGFHVVAGDARDPQVLRRSGVEQCTLAIVSVPDDRTANDIVRHLRQLNPNAKIIMRCRYMSNNQRARKAGADEVVSEEAEASGALLRLCEETVAGAETGKGVPGR
jgi:CPA2 family monovalent cation:H+ antiporter-2